MILFNSASTRSVENIYLSPHHSKYHATVQMTMHYLYNIKAIVMRFHLETKPT